MKNLVKLLGIIAIGVVMSFSMAGCDTGSDDGSGGSGNSGGGGGGGNQGGGGGSTPSAPTGVSATALSSSSIQVTWNSVSGATSYEVWYEIGYSSTKNLASGTVTGTSYTHTGLQANTDYWYYIKAKNSSGTSGYSSSDYATTQSSSGGGGGGTTVPSAPTGVTATRSSTTPSTVTISWNTVSGATSYRVYYSSSNSGSGSLDGSPTTTSFTSTNNSTTSTVYFRVSAVNSAGEGSPSSWVSVGPASGGGGGGGTVEYRIDQPIFQNCTKSGTSLNIGWRLTTSGKTPNGLYTYTSPTSIIVGVWDEDTSTWLETSLSTLSGSARSYTLSNYSYYATSNNQVGIRVRCTSSYGETSSRVTYWISSDYFSYTY